MLRKKETNTNTDTLTHPQSIAIQLSDWIENTVVTTRHKCYTNIIIMDHMHNLN